jgi:bla regulator protein BlaR1
MTPASILAHLAAHLWQSTLFAATAGLATLALRHNPARIRHWLWLAAAVKFLVPFSLLMTLGSRMQWRPAPTAAPAQLTFVMEDASLHQATPASPFQAHAAATAAPAFAEWIPALLLVLWFSGSALLLVRWRIRWRPVASALRRAQFVTGGRELDALRRFGSPSNVRMALSEAALELGVCGLFRPVLLLPAGIATHLSDAQLEAILAHELGHLRRRDNLAAAVQMVVETLFWFHPLVWWIGARMVEERERACDEEVVRHGIDPQIYAWGILQVCRFCMEPPLPGISGITGADLNRRIEGIMTAHPARAMDFGRKLLLAALAIAAGGGPVAIGLLDAPRSHAQSRDAAPVAFEVASVKLMGESNSLPAGFSTNPQRSGGRIHWITNQFNLLRYAYRLQSWRISGVDLIVSVEPFYVIDAKTEESASDDQIRRMFQRLLAERFKIAVHRETKEQNGYALMTSKNGPKIREVKSDDEAPPLPEYFKGKPELKAIMEGSIVQSTEYGLRVITGRRVSMPKLAEALQEPLSAFVLDESGLPGDYYFALEFVPENNPKNIDGPSIFAAIQEQLGLKLEKRKGPVEMLVIDHIEKVPSEN